jgi:hypothetical protein
MSTKTTQTQQAFFDPTSMGAFGQMTGALGPAVSGYIQNPFTNPFFQTQQQMGTQQANLMGQAGMSTLLSNLRAQGISQSSPAAMQMMQQQAMQSSANRANLGFLAPMQSAQAMQQSAMGLAAGYRPLQTGGQQTQMQTGLGSWLPQVAGLGLGLATGGGMGMFGRGAGGGGSTPSPFMPGPWSTGQMPTTGTYNYPSLQSPFMQQ